MGENLNETPKPAPEVAESNFEKAIAESKATLAETSTPKKRGRHPKSCTCENCNTKASVSREASGLPVSELPEGAGSDLPLQVDSFVIGKALAFPFLIAAKRTKFNGFELSDEEQSAVVPQVDAVIKSYMPQAVSKHTALVVCCSTLALVASMKYFTYLEYKEEQQAQREAVKAVKSRESVSKPQAASDAGIDPNQPFPVFGN